MIDVRLLQQGVGMAPALVDGVIGAVTLAALFRKMGATQPMADELGLAANVRFREAGILETPLRLIHFMGQCGLESGGFHYMEEIWGPTVAQKGYEGRKDLGNTFPGDGLKFKGRGPIQNTGRHNYGVLGRKMGIDVERHPDLVAIPSIGLWAATIYWTDTGLNRWADLDDTLACSRGVNRGNPASTKTPNGLSERVAMTEKARKLVMGS